MEDEGWACDFPKHRTLGLAGYSQLPEISGLGYHFRRFLDANAEEVQKKLMDAKNGYFNQENAAWLQKNQKKPNEARFRAEGFFDSARKAMREKAAAFTAQYVAPVLEKAIEKTVQAYEITKEKTAQAYETVKEKTAQVLEPVKEFAQIKTAQVKELVFSGKQKAPHINRLFTSSRKAATKGWTDLVLDSHVDQNKIKHLTGVFLCSEKVVWHNGEQPQEKSDGEELKNKLVYTGEIYMRCGSIVCL